VKKYGTAREAIHDNVAQPERLHMTIQYGALRHMSFAYWITKAINTHNMLLFHCINGYVLCTLPVLHDTET